MRMNRRNFIRTTTASLAAGTSIIASSNQTPLHIPKGKAEHCITIWLGGGAAQMDTWDPKRIGDPSTRSPGSAYGAIKTNLPGVKVCEHLKHSADRMDKMALIRTCYHNIIDEHSAANNFVHTGRKTTGTLTYPSIGSLVAHEKGPLDSKIPPYVVIGYPSIMRGPGFLGPKHSFIYLTDTEKGPLALAKPAHIGRDRIHRRKELLNKLSAIYGGKHSLDTVIQEYLSAQYVAQDISDGSFMKAFDLSNESSSTRQRYGDEFGQRCLLARRLVQSGVRFTEVSFNLNFINGTGWDTHKGGQKNQHHLIQSLDTALTALIDDLESKKLLDKTLIVVATEFGRPIGFDNGGGRGHWSKAFSMVLSGGGLQLGKVIGATDDNAQQPIERPISIPDFHATIHHALGIDYKKSLYAEDRPVPITDNGTPIRELFV